MGHLLSEIIAGLIFGTILIGCIALACSPLIVIGMVIARGVR